MSQVIDLFSRGPTPLVDLVSPKEYDVPDLNTVLLKRDPTPPLTQQDPSFDFSSAFSPISPIEIPKEIELLEKEISPLTIPPVLKRRKLEKKNRRGELYWRDLIMNDIVVDEGLQQDFAEIAFKEARDAICHIMYFCEGVTAEGALDTLKKQIDTFDFDQEINF